MKIVNDQPMCVVPLKELIHITMEFKSLFGIFFRFDPNLRLFIPSFEEPGFLAAKSLDLIAPPFK